MPLHPHRDLVRERDLLEYLVSEEEASLQDLHFWLKWEGLSFLWAFGGLFYPPQIVFNVLGIAALVFTPYMLWQLVKARWNKPIVVFVACVAVPAALSRYILDPFSLSRYLLIAIPLVIFYFYTWILRLVIGSHLQDASSLREIEYARRKRSEEQG